VAQTKEAVHDKSVLYDGVASIKKTKYMYMYLCTCICIYICIFIYVYLFEAVRDQFARYGGVASVR